MPGIFTKPAPQISNFNLGKAESVADYTLNRTLFLKLGCWP